MHSGYIPEQYEADSSQETLYSKLIETLVLEWAIRIGFSKSKLPTQKSSMEDVSILDDKHVIVCDAKSFRLGRSQAAPNVKDVLKHADIEKWLSAYKTEIKLGGLVTFPSQHDWKKGSDYYQYTTDLSSPTVSLYYEHLAFFLISGMTSKNLISIFLNYPTIFPKKISKNENNRDKYYSGMEKFLLSDHENLWKKYASVSQEISKEKVFHTSTTLDILMKQIRKDIEKSNSQETDVEVLRQKAIEAEYSQATDYLHKQKNRISAFRDMANKYYEEK